MPEQRTKVKPLHKSATEVSGHQPKHNRSGKKEHPLISKKALTNIYENSKEVI